MFIAMNVDRLFFHEELLLLALQDEKGRVFFGAMVAQAMAGGLIAELFLSGRARMETEKKKQFVKLIDARPFDDPILNECLDQLSCAKRRATIQTWVQRFAGIRRLQQRAAERLCEKGVLKEESRKVLWLFSQRVFPERNPKPEREIIARLRSAIFKGAGTVDPRTTVLLSLAHGTGLLAHVFDKKQLKERRKRIEQVVHGEACGKAASEAVQAAVMVAVVVPLVVSTMMTTTTR